MALLAAKSFLQALLANVVEGTLDFTWPPSSCPQADKHENTRKNLRVLVVMRQFYTRTRHASTGRIKINAPTVTRPTVPMRKASIEAALATDRACDKRTGGENKR
jgi:hypothetical protein